MQKDKVYFARKYGLAERDIAPEFLPLLIAFDDVNEQNRELADKIRGGIVTNTHEHYYEGMTPLSALLLRWGWVPPLFFVLITGSAWPTCSALTECSCSVWKRWFNIMTALPLTVFPQISISWRKKRDSRGFI